MEKFEMEFADNVKSIWIKAIETADSFVSKSELAELSECIPAAPAENVAGTFPMELFHMKRLAYSTSEGIVDKLVNVYASMNSIGSSVYTIIHGEKNGTVEFYIGCLSRNNGEASKLMLKSSFEGNFPGIELEHKNGEQKNKLLDRFFPLDYQKQSIASVSVSADYRKEKAEENISYIQGIEKFIDTMKGQEYTALFLAEPISHFDCISKRLAYENIITELSKFNKVTLNYSENNSVAVNKSLSEGTSESIAHSVNSSISSNTSVSIGKTKASGSGNAFGFFGSNVNFSRNMARTKNSTSGEGQSSGISDSTTYGTSKNVSKGETNTSGSSAAITVNVENKTISNIISKLEYELKKLDNADSFGLWDVAVYIVSGDANTPIIAANSIRSLVIGDESGKAESFINYWDNSARSFSNGATGRVMQFLHYGMHPVFYKKTADAQQGTYYFTPAVSVNGKALPSVMGLPMRSVPGVTVIESAEFGRNIVTDDHAHSGNRRIQLGEVIYMGKKDSTLVNFFVNSLSLHTFICGAPGSGKSNTVYKLMYELCRLNSKPERDDGFGNVKFLVIEPAKGEYKYEFGKMPNINIFTTKTGLCRMLCINPFEFPYEQMDVLEHIERLKNIISACWPLTAAMPSILSNAIEQVYVRCGWDIDNSMYVLPGKIKFPCFNDILKILPVLIDSSDYSPQAKGDYKGALVTRVASLTRGIAGTVFSSAGTVPDSVLFDENTIIDLSTVGSSETRSLIMGILVMKLENYRKATATQSNYPLRHVTILEEAHNLLPRCSTAQSDESSNVQGKSVESISNAISEMRTYGEGFIIVDQSPSAVASVAVSNTSTKIIMRLPAEEDVKAAGSSIGLNAEQMSHIPMLPQGQAIVKQGNWITPVVTLVDKAPSTHRTRKLPTYYYEDLKSFRAELIDKIYQVNERNIRRNKFATADRDSIVRFIDKQIDVAPDQLERIKSCWLDYCQYSAAARHPRLNLLIMDILSFRQGLIMCAPIHAESYGADEISEWANRIEEILRNYVDADDELLFSIICSVIRYCVYYHLSDDMSLCASCAMKLLHLGK